MKLLSLFYGPDGLRAGWRTTLYLLLAAALLALSSMAWSLVLYHSLRPKTVEIGPAAMLVIESLNLTAIVLTLLIFAHFERISFFNYGLPRERAFRGRFWGGIVLGFVGMTLLLLAIGLLHGFDLGSTVDPPATEARYGALYSLGFLLVGFFEELMMRSYPLYTLTRGVGFWWAAAISSVLFALVHLGNSGEGAIGIFAVFCAGMLFCFFVRRTGNLWFAIGFHASWDWAQTYFYGVPDSGTIAAGNLFHSHFTGPKWLTGGSVGPEGSYLVFVILAGCALLVHLAFPQAKYPTEEMRAWKNTSSFPPNAELGSAN